MNVYVAGTLKTLAANRADPMDEVADSIRLEAESSLQLLQRARVGDREALERLIARYLPRLQRWATGRLPRWARDLADTQDLVQETVVRTFNRIEAFNPEGEGALQAYLRQALLNRIRDEIRRARRHPSAGGLGDEHVDPAASPLEEAIGQEALERYETALSRLRPEDREVIVARVEMGCRLEEVALALGKPTANAARVAVDRALVRLAQEMRRVD